MAHEFMRCFFTDMFKVLNSPSKVLSLWRWPHRPTSMVATNPIQQSHQRKVAIWSFFRWVFQFCWFVWDSHHAVHAKNEQKTSKRPRDIITELSCRFLFGKIETVVGIRKYLWIQRFAPWVGAVSDYIFSHMVSSRPFVQWKATTSHCAWLR